MSDLQKIDDSGELDLNFAVGGEEQPEGYVQIDLNMQAQQGSSPVHSDLRYQNPVSSYCKSHSVATELDPDDTRRTKIAYDQERTQSPNQGEMDELPGSYFHKSSEFKAQTFHREKGTEDSADLQELPLTEDNHQIEETEGISYIDRPNTSPRDKKVKDTPLQKSRYEFNKSSNYEIVEGEGIEDQEGKFSCYSRPRSVDCAVEQKNEKCNSSRNSPAESRKLDMQHSTPHSVGSNHRKSASPRAVKLMLVSRQGSPQVHLSPDGHRPLSLQECVQDRLRSPSPHREKHSSSPKRSDLAKRIPPHDHLSPSATRTKLSPKRSQQGSRHKDGSSLKRLSASPEPQYSPKRHGRSNRSISRSPIRRRDPVSRYERDYHDRSHSRSAYTRDRHRSPRRRSPGYHSHHSSPRRRSPGYHSHHSSPRRKPWSPPPNRRTGLGKPGNNLFVAGFNFLTTERDLERKFSRFGRVRDVRIVRDNRSGDSRGFGFLSMESDEDADAAIRALDETEWNGRIILVEKSKSTR